MKQRKKEVSQVGVIGVIATVIDYLALNALVGIFGVPAVLSSAISSGLGSIYSYKLNKKITYEGRMHGVGRTLITYVAIAVSGIIMFQIGVFYLINSVFEAPVNLVIHTINIWLSSVDFNEDVVRLNSAKLVATITASIWSYLMTRRFVYAVTEDEKHHTS